MGIIFSTVFIFIFTIILAFYAKQLLFMVFCISIPALSLNE